MYESLRVDCADNRSRHDSPMPTAHRCSDFGRRHTDEARGLMDHPLGPIFTAHFTVSFANELEEPGAIIIRILYPELLFRPQGLVRNLTLRDDLHRVPRISHALSVSTRARHDV